MALFARMNLSKEIVYQFNLYNCIFRPEKGVILPAFTQDMKNIAAFMYENNDFSDWFALRDMFLDAGTTDKQVLQHLKNKVHVLGDWLVDAILDK